MDDIAAIFVGASAVVALLLVEGVASVVVTARCNNAPPDPDLDKILRILNDMEAGK